MEALSRHHIRHICIAPGSRSTPLILAAASNGKFTLHTHFDERGLGFLALGLAKADDDGVPVAVIVTSGTAVVNLYSSLVEASLTGHRLVLLTADRPAELIDCDSNQAIRQIGIFADYPTRTINLPRPTPDIPARWLVSTIDHGVNTLRYGVLHVNVPFAEPLYGYEAWAANAEWKSGLGTWWRSDHPWLIEAPEQSTTVVSDWTSWRRKRGVVIAGRISSRHQGVQVAHWTRHLGWPLIADTLSQTGQPLPYADLWLDNPRVRAVLGEAQLVIQFGTSLTGKRLLRWRESCTPEEYWIIDPTKERRLDPSNHRGRKITCDIGAWIAQHPAQRNQPWAKELEPIVKKVHSLVQQTLPSSSFSETLITHKLTQLLPKDGQLFIGNSLCVRLVDALGQLPAGYPVYSNRGASGIDGVIATVSGIQRVSAKPTLAIMGDLAALYDLNSLPLLRSPTAHIALIVLNNNGGRIFSMFPVPEPILEQYYRMPQNVNFDHAAAMFGLRYIAPSSWSELKQTLLQFWRTSRPDTLLVEAKVNGTETIEKFQQLSLQAANL